jgi:hypothetical protein
MDLKCTLRESKEQRRISYPASKKMMNETELLKSTVPTPRHKHRKKSYTGSPAAAVPQATKMPSFMAFTATKPC